MEVDLENFPARLGGQPVRLATCNGGAQQQWDLISWLDTPPTFTIRYANSPPDWPLCLAVDTDYNNQDQLYVDFCDDLENPRSSRLWGFAEGSDTIMAANIVTGPVNKCVDAGDMSLLFRLMIWDCNGLTQQKWGYDPGMKTIYLSDSRRLQGGLSSAMAEFMHEGSSRSLRGSPPAEQAAVNTSRESGALRVSGSGGVTCDGQGGELEGAAGSFCCGDPGKQIVCGPGSACGEGEDRMPICQVPGGIACQGVAGELRGAAGSKCCGASGRQIVCGPGSHCAGSDRWPICGGPVACAGRAGIPLTAAAGSICCGDKGYQIACGAGARCAGRPHLPICLAR
jgi:hypothetical protein